SPPDLCATACPPARSDATARIIEQYACSARRSFPAKYTITIAIRKLQMPRITLFIVADGIDIFQKKLDPCRSGT
ncbi:MAG: hypothetical protein SVR04_13170, partial [Spirochaetota bacterium]|nr:hypothetical protein [Spirochaetota bacterium]